MLLLELKIRELLPWVYQNYPEMAQTKDDQTFTIVC